MKQYEITNHPPIVGQALGNVLTTVTDNKLAVNSGGMVSGYLAQISSSSDYYPFGSLQPGRNFNAGDYRFGLIGKENDNEVKGTGNSVDFGARIYDSRLGRWMSVDPQFKANTTPYFFGLGNPVIFVDPDGETDFYFNEKWIGSDGNTNNLVAKVTSKRVRRDIVKSTRNGRYYTQQSISKAAENKGGVLLVNKDVLQYSFAVLKASLTPAGKNGEFGNTLTQNGDHYFTNSKMLYMSCRSIQSSALQIPSIGDVSKHSHQTGIDKTTGEVSQANVTSKNNVDSDDQTFKKFETNIIVGMNGVANEELIFDKYGHIIGKKYNENDRYAAINFFDKNTQPLGTIKYEKVSQCLKMIEGKWVEFLIENDQNK